MRRDTKWDRPPVEHRSNVFISGTYKDLAYIRRHVAAAIEKAGESALEPLDTAGSNEDIREKIRRQIQLDAHLYVGVFGTRYGYRVSSEEGALSYTHFEFQEALEKWKTVSPPPIAVFLPDPGAGSDFYQEIKAKCDAELAKLDAASRAADEQRQQEFRELVQRPNGDPLLGNKMVNFVATLDELCFRVGIWVKSYKFDTLFLWVDEMSAGPPKRTTPDPARWPLQLEQVESISRRLDHAAASSSAPGVCLLVHCARSQGQFDLVSLVTQSRFWHTDTDPVQLVLERVHELNEQAIWNALWEATGYGPNGDLADPDDLAKELLETGRPVVVVVRQIQLLGGGRIKRFAERIWQPVYDGLLRASRGLAPASLNSRLIVVLAYEGRDFELEDSLSCSADLLPDTVDFRKVVRLAKVS
jgi:hypothetical protein